MSKVGKKRKLKLISYVVAVLGVVVFTVQSFGQDPGFEYSYVAPPPYPEKNHAQILKEIYGGTFTQSGVNYSNETISALRVYDSDQEEISLNLLTDTLEGKVDQLWTDGVVTVTAEVKFASLHQSFGWNGGGTGTTYQELLTEEDIGGPGVVVNIDGDFLWGCWPTDRYQWNWHDGDGCYHWWDTFEGCWHPEWPAPPNPKWWTLESNNVDGKDHFVTYKITGLGGPESVWLLFMEDLCYSYADKDYNDFVVQLSAIPEPATVALLALGAVMLLKKRR